MQRFNGLRKCGCLEAPWHNAWQMMRLWKKEGRMRQRTERSRGKEWTATWVPACSQPQSFLRARCILDNVWCGMLNCWTQFFTPLLSYYISTPSQGLLVRKDTSLPFHSGLGWVAYSGQWNIITSRCDVNTGFKSAWMTLALLPLPWKKHALGATGSRMIRQYLSPAHGLEPRATESQLVHTHVSNKSMLTVISHVVWWGSLAAWLCNWLMNTGTRRYLVLS